MLITDICFVKKWHAYVQRNIIQGHAKCKLITQSIILSQNMNSRWQHKQAIHYSIYITNTEQVLTVLLANM